MPFSNCQRLFQYRDARSQRGATVVEFAIVAALVLVFIFGILEYGLIFLQEHYVANAAREGARIGIRANNYNCFGGSIATGFTVCTSDRVVKTQGRVVEYLDVFYDADDLTVTVTSQDLGGEDGTGKVLQVSVQAPNFVPGLVSGIMKLLRSSSNVKNPGDISFTTSMAYEDPREYDAENP